MLAVWFPKMSSISVSIDGRFGKSISCLEGFQPNENGDDADVLVVPALPVVKDPSDRIRVFLADLFEVSVRATLNHCLGNHVRIHRTKLKGTTMRFELNDQDAEERLPQISPKQHAQASGPCVTSDRERVGCCGRICEDSESKAKPISIHNNENRLTGTDVVGDHVVDRHPVQQPRASPISSIRNHQGKPNTIRRCRVAKKCQQTSHTLDMEKDTVNMRTDFKLGTVTGSTQMGNVSLKHTMHQLQDRFQRRIP